MVHGKVVEKLAQIYENDEGGIVGGGSEPVDERTECPKSKPNSNIMQYDFSNSMKMRFSVSWCTLSSIGTAVVLGR